ncbi:MAG: DUF805 domain-containing protein [Pseudomonadota bacterium]
MKDFYFSAKGRVSRKDYWLKFVLPIIGVYIVAVVIIGGLMAALGDAGAIAGILALPLLIGVFWASICVGAKRFHDRGWSGWWVLYFFLIGLAIMVVQYGAVFIFGESAIGAMIAGVAALASLGVSIWQLVLLGFLPGDKGPNAYGEDPLNPTGGTAETFA